MVTSLFFSAEGNGKKNMATIEYPERIKKIKAQLAPWEIGAGTFKEDTPPEILKLHEELIKYLHETNDSVQ